MKLLKNDLKLNLITQNHQGNTIETNKRGGNYFTSFKRVRVLDK